MARFTETDQAARLLQQILAMPSAGGDSGASDGQDAWMSAYEPGDAEADAAPAPWSYAAAPVDVAPPPAAFAGEAVVREIVETRAGQVELKLHVAPQAAAEAPGGQGETVGDFFRRVVRPLPTDPSTV